MPIAALAILIVYYYIFLRYCAALVPTVKASPLSGRILGITLLVLTAYFLRQRDYSGLVSTPLIWPALTIALRLATGMNNLQAICVAGFSVLCAYGVRAAIGSLISLVLYDLAPSLFFWEGLHDLFTLFTIPSTLLLLWMMCRYILKAEDAKKLLGSKPAMIEFIVYEASACINLLILNEGRWSAESPLWYMQSLLGISILVVGVLFSLVHYTVQSAKMFTYRLHSQMMEEQYEVQLRHYKSYEKGFNQLRAFKHDYKALLESLGKLIQAGEIEEAQKLIGSGSRGVDDENAGFVRYSRNIVFDAILQSLSDYCTEMNINLTVEVASPDGLPLNQIDTIRVMHNVLRNAAEACAKLPENKQWIRVVSYLRDQWCYLEISNAFDGKVRKKGSKILTTKADEGNHGMGIGIISDTVERAGGLVTFTPQMQDGIFLVQVMVPRAPIN